MPQPICTADSYKMTGNQQQNVGTIGLNKLSEKEWIKNPKQDQQSQQAKRKQKPENERYLIDVNSARDYSPRTARTTHFYVVKHNPSSHQIPKNRLEETHVTKTQGYNQMLSVLRSNNTVPFNRKTILPFHIQGLQKVNGCTYRSPTGKCENDTKGRQTQQSLAKIGISSRSTDRLESLIKRHQKNLSEMISTNTHSNASLGIVHASKMRTKPVQHPDGLGKRNEFGVEPIKKKHAWLPKVPMCKGSTQSHQNILASSWSSLTNNQRWMNGAGHRRRGDNFWRYDLLNNHVTGEHQSSMPIKPNSLLSMSMETVPGTVLTTFPKVSATSSTTSMPPGVLWPFSDYTKLSLDNEPSKETKCQPVVPSLDSIAENQQSGSHLTWSKRMNTFSNLETVGAKQAEENATVSGEQPQSVKNVKELMSRTPVMQSKPPLSVGLLKGDTFPNSQHDEPVSQSKENSDHKLQRTPSSCPEKQRQIETAMPDPTYKSFVESNSTKTSTTKKSDNSSARNKISWPIHPNTALNLYGNGLTAFERQEVDDYTELWFLGLEAQKIHGIPGAPSNAGYDDEHGTYLKVTNDHLAYRYEVLETLGKGSFGRVVRAIDHQTGKTVAIKIIRNKRRFHQQAQIEVAVLEELKKADPTNTSHIIHIRDHFIFRNHLCIVFDLMGHNLYEVLKKNEFRGFTMHSLRKIASKVLSCLILLRKQGIIHCDLKPENILIGNRNSSELRVIDFGSSCYTNRRVYTYIQSRFYRAPEIILGIPYGTPIDIWSFGCILPELFTGRPLFPGENENEQLACMMELLGPPPESLLDKATRRRIFFDSKGSPRNLINSKGRKRLPGSRNLQELIKSSDTKFLDLIQQCLRWNPEERISPNAALNHDWFKQAASRSKF